MKRRTRSKIKRAKQEFNRQDVSKEVEHELPIEELRKNHLSLLNTIIAATYSRHSDLSSEKFLEAIHFPKDMDESKAIRIAKFNTLIDATRTAFDIRHGIRYINQLLRLYINNESITDDKNKE